VEATDLLMKEHRIIERALDAMDRWLTTLAPEADQANKDELARYVSFIRGFADAYHHGKEEDILFAVMVQHGFPRQVGPIAVMLQEHDMGRSLVNVLDELTRQSTPWRDDDRIKLEQAVRELSALLRQHIRKEDLILYPMADARLPASAQEEMLRRFQDFETQQTQSGEKARLQELTDALI
jgi:hemerythrin-like domain-containing protein